MADRGIASMKEEDRKSGKRGEERNKERRGEKKERRILITYQVVTYQVERYWVQSNLDYPNLDYPKPRLSGWGFHLHFHLIRTALVKIQTSSCSILLFLVLLPGAMASIKHKRVVRTIAVVGR